MRAEAAVGGCEVAVGAFSRIQRRGERARRFEQAVRARSAAAAGLDGEQRFVDERCDCVDDGRDLQVAVGRDRDDVFELGLAVDDGDALEDETFVRRE